MWLRGLILLSIVFVFACGKEASYQACPVPQSMAQKCSEKTMKDLCGPLGLDCYASCVVEDHPVCNGDPCLIYNYKDMESGQLFMSKPFCTFECDPANEEQDCGKDAKCMPYLGKYYCVPTKYIQKSQQK